MAYDRSSPSPRYAELLGQYREMHLTGDPLHGIPAEMTFNGISLGPHVNRIKSLIRRFRATSVLDYGCGKADGYRGATVERADGGGWMTLEDFWGVDEIGLYDPAVAAFSALPDRGYDAVVCTDVLEHCPENDIDWIVGEIFGYAGTFVYATVALYPATKHLPDGTNAHVTLKDAAWWEARFAEAAERAPGVRYVLALMRSPTEATEVEG